MKLEEIAKTYGMVDYYDQHTGYTYKLSEASDTPCEGVELKPGQLRVPVWNEFDFLGYAVMNKLVDRK